MKRFFQSLHQHSGGSTQPVAVARTECNREMWEQASIIQRLQKDLAYYYHQNFLLQTELTTHLLDHQLHAVAIDADKESPAADDTCNECVEPVPKCQQEPTCPVSPSFKPQPNVPDESAGCPVQKKQRKSHCSPCSSSSRSPPSIKDRLIRRFASSDHELVPKFSAGFVPQSSCSSKPKSETKTSSSSHKSWTRIFRSKERKKFDENPTQCGRNKNRGKTDGITPCQKQEASACNKPDSSCQKVDEASQCSYQPSSPFSPRTLGTSNSDGSLIEHHRAPSPRHLYLPLTPRVNFENSTFAKATSGDQSRTQSRIPPSPPPSPVAFPFSAFEVGCSDTAPPPLAAFTPSSEFTQTDFDIPCDLPRASECTQTQQPNVSTREASCEIESPPTKSPVTNAATDVNERSVEWRQLARKILTTSIQAEYLGINKYKTYNKQFELCDRLYHFTIKV